MSSDPSAPGGRLAKRWSLLLGATAIGFSALVVWVAGRSTAATVLGTIEAGNLRLARTLAGIADNSAEAARRERINAVQSAWDRAVGRNPEQFLCVVDAAGALELHTGRPAMVGHNVSEFALDPDRSTPLTVRSLLSGAGDWVGENLDESGDRQIVAFAWSSSLHGLVAVHTPRSSLEAAVAAATGAFRWGFGVVAVLLLPAILLLHHRSWRAIQRRSSSHYEAMLESESRYRELFDGANDLVHVFAPDNTLLYVNRAWQSALGYSAEAVRGRSVLDFMDPAHHAQCAEAFRRVLAGEQLELLSCVFLAAGGSAIEVEGQISVRRLQGVPESLCGIFRDVTAKHAAARERAKSEQRWLGLIETAPAVIATLTADGTICLASNPGTTLQEWAHPGDSIWDLVLPSHHDGVRAAMESALTSPLPQAVEVEIRSAGGATRWCRPQFAQMPHPIGDEALVAVVTDITEQRDEEVARLAAQRMEVVGQLAAGVAHDFNNTLSGILGFASLIRDAVPEDSPVQPDVLQIERAVERSAGLVRQLLDIGHRSGASAEAVHVSSAVRGLERVLRGLLREDIHLRLQFPDSSHWVSADAARFEQALLNLVVNARDAITGGGTVLVSVAPGSADEPDTVRVGVGDTGTGIPAEVLARIFDPFFTTKPLTEGTGLGLPMVQAFAAAAAGRVEVDSTPGEGTTVTLVLPTIPAPPSTEPAPAVADAASPPATDAVPSRDVLIVEDFEMLRSLMAATLRERGHRVRTASDGAMGLAMALGHPPDLLITDLVLPEQSGCEIVEAVRRVHPGMAVIYITGYADQELLERAMASTDTPLLLKPFSPTDLRAAVAAVFSADPGTDPTPGS